MCNKYYQELQTSKKTLELLKEFTEAGLEVQQDTEEHHLNPRLKRAKKACKKAGNKVKKAREQLRAERHRTRELKKRLWELQGMEGVFTNLTRSIFNKCDAGEPYASDSDSGWEFKCGCLDDEGHSSGSDSSEDGRKINASLEVSGGLEVNLSADAGGLNASLSIGGDDSPDDDELDIVVGLRIKQDDGSSLMRKVKLHCKPKTKVKHIVKAVNKVLAKADGVDMEVDRLVPLWTPTWDHFDKDKKMIKVLKHSVNGSGEDYDAREMDPIRMVGVDADQFDADFWNEHLDFLAEEYEWFDAEEFSESSDGGDASGGAASSGGLEVNLSADAGGLNASLSIGGDDSPDDDELDIVVGLRIKQDDGSSLMRKVKLHCKPKTKVKHIVKAVNKVLAKADGVDMEVDRLVPLWTPTWDHFDKDKKMIKVLKHSVNGSGEDYDAREMDPIRMVGVDADQFDADFWNEHLDFLAEEYEWFDAEEFSESD